MYSTACDLAVLPLVHALSSGFIYSVLPQIFFLVNTNDIDDLINYNHAHFCVMGNIYMQYNKNDAKESC